MYQSLVEGREVPWSLLVKDMPEERHRDLDWIVDQLDWEANVDPYFKKNHFLDPIPVDNTESEGYLDRWVVYGRIEGKQYFSAKELTVFPGTRCRIVDQGAYGLIVVQGQGKMNQLELDCPKMIRFHDITMDEVFCTEAAAREGAVFENTSPCEDLVVLRYFGPEVNDEAPEIGDGR
jgi:hypothetical protein